MQKRKAAPQSTPIKTKILINYGKYKTKAGSSLPFRRRNVSLVCDIDADESVLRTRDNLKTDKNDNLTTTSMEEICISFFFFADFHFRSSSEEKAGINVSYTHLFLELLVSHNNLKYSQFTFKTFQVTTFFSWLVSFLKLCRIVCSGCRFVCF